MKQRIKHDVQDDAQPAGEPEHLSDLPIIVRMGIDAGAHRLSGQDAQNADGCNRNHHLTVANAGETLQQIGAEAADHHEATKKEQSHAKPRWIM